MSNIIQKNVICQSEKRVFLYIVKNHNMRSKYPKIVSD
jgi:hypothetical protein